MKWLKFGCLVLFCNLAWAHSDPVMVSDGWVRATVPGQKATGAFMKITAKEPARLVSVTSPVAGVVEIHEMKMDKDVMQMSALVKGLELPAGQTVELKPGGYHVMLMDLKAPLAATSTVPVKMTFRDVRGNRTVLELNLPVQTTPSTSGPMHGGHHH